MVSAADEARLRRARFRARDAQEYVGYLADCLRVARQDLEARERELASAEALVENADHE